MRAKRAPSKALRQHHAARAGPAIAAGEVPARSSRLQVQSCTQKPAAAWIACGRRSLPARSADGTPTEQRQKPSCEGLRPSRSTIGLPGTRSAPALHRRLKGRGELLGSVRVENAGTTQVANTTPARNRKLVATFVKGLPPLNAVRFDASRSCFRTTLRARISESFFPRRVCLHHVSLLLNHCEVEAERSRNQAEVFACRRALH